MKTSNCVFNIVDYGAVPDGQTKNTEAIRKAIAACKTAGGGTVWVPAGQFFTGPIILASNITLHVDAGAHLLFSQSSEDYPTVQGRWNGVYRYGHCPCVFAENAENVSVVGRGILDGQGKAWWDAVRKQADGEISPQLRERIAEFDRLDITLGLPGIQGYRPSHMGRPSLLRFKECRNVLVQGVTLTNSPFWTLHPLFCENVTIHAVTLINPPDSTNTDGINPDSCRNVRISDCYVDVGDDCVTIKSGYDEDGRRIGRPCENITVTNCTMVHGHGGVVIGSEMSGGVRNVVISNCIFDGTHRGIRIKSRRGRGGIVEDIRVSNIIMRRVLAPLVINLYYSCGGDPNDKYLYGSDPKPIDEGTPIIRNIHFANITARDIRGTAAFLYGLPEMPIEGLTFTDIRMSPDPHETQGGWPAAFWGMDAMVARGFNCTNARNIVLKNIDISARQGPAVNLASVADVEVLDLRAAVADSQVPAVVLADSKSVIIRDSRRPVGTETFCKITGSQSRDILLAGNQFADDAVQIDSNVAPHAVAVR